MPALEVHTYPERVVDYASGWEEEKWETSARCTGIFHQTYHHHHCLHFHPSMLSLLSVMESEQLFTLQVGASSYYGCWSGAVFIKTH